jgi:hypothetical protein
MDQQDHEPSQHSPSLPVLPSVVPTSGEGSDDRYAHSMIEHCLALLLTTLGTTQIHTSQLSQICPVIPDYDLHCVVLESDCDSMGTIIERLHLLVELLPVHAVIRRFFPSLTFAMGEESIWELEKKAAQAFDAAQASGFNQDWAERMAHDACTRWILHCFEGQDIFDIPKSILDLIAGIITQICHRHARRIVTDA